MVWDKFLPKFQLRQLGFTYNVCGPFADHRKRIQNFRETGKLKYIYKNELDKTYFFHNVAYSDSKNLAIRTVSDKILKDKANDIVIIPKHDG